MTDSYRTADYDAPPGTVWVCSACGKTAQNRIEGSPGWDESCFLRAVLCEADSLVIDIDGRIRNAKLVERDTDP